MLLSDIIKPATKTEHQSLEKLIVGRIKNTGSLTQYGQLLKMFFGFYQPIEIKIDQYINSSIIPDYSQRRKSAHILHDLSILKEDLSNDQQNLTTDTSFINSASTALGALYVLEGSTLGGTIIAGMLSRYAHVPVDALSFFNGYGEKNPLMWNAFVNSMNAFGNKNDHHEIVQAAKQTFDQFRIWAELFYKAAPSNTYA